MDKESNLLYFKMCLLQAEITMNAMIVANKEREIQGHSLAYNEEAFLGLIKEFNIHDNPELLKVEDWLWRD